MAKPAGRGISRAPNAIGPVPHQGMGSLWGERERQAGGNSSEAVPAPSTTPNSYEDSLCQETNSSCERIVLIFFRFPGPGAVCSQSRVLTSFLWCGAPPVWLHHTRIEALSSPRWRVQSTIGSSLCGLEILWCPRTVLRQEMAAPQRRASACQARERGSPRPFVRLLPLMQEPESMSKQSRGL